MKNYKIAWRNLWRNKRRTLITGASVFFAVFFALVMRSVQLGSYDHMFRNVIESYTGYIQIQHEDFWDSRIIDDVFEYSHELEQLLLDDENVNEVVPRFESFALASIGKLTKGVLVMGIDPEKENRFSDVKGKLVKYRFTDEAILKLKESELPGDIKDKLDMLKGSSYSGDGLLQAEMGIKRKEADKLMIPFREYASFPNEYIAAGEQEALIGDRLSRFLELNIGDTIVLIGQGYHATTAAAKFRISGIVKMPTPDLDNMIVYLPYDVCQEFYNAPRMVTSVAVDIIGNDEKALEATVSSIGAKLAPPLRVVDWREMNEVLISQMDADNKSGMIMIAILYLVIAFGIFGTVLMMTAERKREFGMVVAIGMQKTKLSAVVVIEMFYIGMMGIIAGIIAAIPVIIIGYYHPIRFSGEMAKMFEDYGMEPVMPFMPVDWYFMWQTVVVAIILLIAVSYPVNKVLRLNTANALKA